MIILVALTFVSINTLQKTAWAPMPFAKTVFQLLSCLTRRTPASSRPEPFVSSHPTFTAFMVKSTITQKLPPPPRMAQKSSACVLEGAASTIDPSASTTVADSRLSTLQVYNA